MRCLAKEPADASRRSRTSSAVSRAVLRPARRRRRVPAARRTADAIRRDRAEATRTRATRQRSRGLGRRASAGVRAGRRRSAGSRSASGSAAAAWGSSTSRGIPILQREVAIKVATRVEEEKARRAILREARASSHLQVREHRHDLRRRHRGGLPVHRDGVRARHRRSREIIEEEGPLDRRPRSGSLARGILDGLIYAHEGEKPGHPPRSQAREHPLRGRRREDRGLRDRDRDGRAAPDDERARCDRPAGGGAEGSVLTISPEQANNKPADHRSDIYSLGCVLYMMATGRPPFQGNQIAILYQHVDEEARAADQDQPRARARPASTRSS